MGECFLDRREVTNIIDTIKIPIYDNGYENTTLTGGWTSTGYSEYIPPPLSGNKTIVPATKYPTYINVKSQNSNNNNHYACIIGTNNKVDLTEYDYIRVTVNVVNGYLESGAGDAAELRRILMYVLSEKRVEPTYYISYYHDTTGNIGEVEWLLDVSNINEDVYIAFRAYSWSLSGTIDEAEFNIIKVELEKGMETPTSPSYVVYNPYSDALSNSTCITQLHCHTTNSDGAMSPSAVESMYYDKGYNALAITDHNYITTHSMMMPIEGNEVTLSTGHISSLFNAYEKGSETNIQVIIDSIRENDGIAIINHPNWYNLMNIANISDYDNFNGIEIFNAICESDVQGKQGFALDVWDYLLTNKSSRILGTAADDFHNSSDLPSNVGRIIAFALSRNIKSAIERGCFVADVGVTNVTLKPPVVDATNITLNCPGAEKIRFIGDSGTLLKESVGSSATYNYTADNPNYVRCEVVGKYTDGFDVNTGSWIYPYGSWNITSGVLRNTTAQDLPPACAYLLKPIHGDFDIYFEAKVNSNVSGTSYFGLTFHCHNAKNITGAHSIRSGYFLNMYRNTNLARLYRNDGGTFTTLAEATPTINLNTWYCIRVQRSGGAIKVKWWAKSSSESSTWNFNVTDNNHNHGWIALVSLNAVTEFDNFEVIGIKSYYQPIVIHD